MKLAVTITTPDVSKPSPVALLEGTLQQKIMCAADLGYDGVELMVLEPERVDVRELLRLLDATQMSAAAVASGAQVAQAGLTLLAGDLMVREAACTRLFALIDLAQAIGARLVTVGGFRGRTALVATGEGRAEFVQALQRACSHAESGEVLLALEPLNRYETDIVITVAEGLRLCDEVDSPALGLLVDTFHANIEEPSIEGSLRAAVRAGRLFHVHLGDSNRLAPGRGHIDFERIVRTLVDLGYDGYLSAELFPKPTPDAAAVDTARHMRRYVPSPQKEMVQ